MIQAKPYRVSLFTPQRGWHYTGPYFSTEREAQTFAGRLLRRERSRRVSSRSNYGPANTGPNARRQVAGIWPASSSRV
jgi:hypothetical protein